MNTETDTYTRTVDFGTFTMDIVFVKVCERCETDAYVPHFNCSFPGQRGHSSDHCTAGSCY